MIGNRKAGNFPAFFIFARGIPCKVFNFRILKCLHVFVFVRIPCG